MKNLLLSVLIALLVVLGCDQNPSKAAADTLEETSRVKPLKKTKKEVTKNQKLERTNAKIALPTQTEEKKERKRVSTCSLPKKHAKHVNPYHYRQLTDYFDEEQVDFSTNHYELSDHSLSHWHSEFDSLAQYDFSDLWLKNSAADGVIGKNYRYINIKILKVKKSQRNPLIYDVIGESKVGDNRCDFKGEIQLTKGYYFEEGEIKKATQGVVLAKYRFLENANQKYVGTFEGTLESSFIINHKDHNVSLDEGSLDADGYSNNTFVGTWVAYNSNNLQKCIWGDYRLPFTFDYDIGDGEMWVNPKYRNQ